MCGTAASLDVTDIRQRAAPCSARGRLELRCVSACDKFTSISPILLNAAYASHFARSIFAAIPRTNDDSG